MGQNITCLITDKNIELNKNIVHFRIKNVLFIPFEILSSLSGFIEDALEYDTISELFDPYKKYSSEDLIYDKYQERHSVLDIIKLVEDFRIDNFIIEHSSDFADIPVDDFFMSVVNGKIMKDSLVFDEEAFSMYNYKNNIEKYRQNIGLDFNWISMSKFHSYSSAERDYNNLH